MPRSSKGAQFERELCERFSLWWTNSKRDDIFWRSNASGARATVRSKKGKKTAGQYGDICATDPCGKALTELITIEIKRGYPQASIHDLLDRTKTSADRQYDKWLRQILYAHQKAGTYAWMLIHRKDHRQSIVIVPKSLISSPTTAPYLAGKIKVRRAKQIGVKRIQSIVCFPLDWWFEQITPGIIKELYKLHRSA